MRFPLCGAGGAVKGSQAQQACCHSTQACPPGEGSPVAGAEVGWSQGSLAGNPYRVGAAQVPQRNPPHTHTVLYETAFAGRPY